MLLERISGPGALKTLSLSELEPLAAEVREVLVETVTANGGHLASNLGVVELTIALHRAFDSPRDKIIWDVSHQSYVHKLLTGRRDVFSSLRQYGGISGFADRTESAHDAFGAGHASTSVSAALGMALARDLAGDKYHVVAVIGDGALSGGMAFEALNHAGHLGTRLIVVLNDNGMAISPSVGAVARMLNEVRLDPRYEQAKQDAKRVLNRMPLGPRVWRFSKAVKNGVKKALTPAAFWGELGFDYIGPVDGHNFNELERALERARQSSQPTLVYVLTQKGKGYPPAEDDCVGFHGVAPNGSSSSKAPSYSKVFGQTVARLLAQNPRVVAITAAMLQGTGLDKAAQQFPGRVLDVAICEQHAVTMAAGMTTQGFVPIVAVYSTFLQRGYDQIIHDVCLQELPVVFAIDRAGIVGDDGKTHQGTLDISYLACIPNMVVAAPKDENELQHMIYTATKAGRPMAVRYPRGSGVGVVMDAEFHELPLGKGEVLRQGKDAAILALGNMVYPALEAAQLLSDSGVECTVVNARFAKPLDEELILEVADATGRLVTVEENALAGGFGSRVLQLLASSGRHQVRVECLGISDRFVEHGPQPLLRSLFDLDSQGIARRVTEAFPELKSKATVPPGGKAGGRRR